MFLLNETKKRKIREPAFENEEGRVWEVIKPMFSTATCLHHTQIHSTYILQTAKRTQNEVNIWATYLPFKANHLIEFIEVV